MNEEQQGLPGTEEAVCAGSVLVMPVPGLDEVLEALRAAETSLDGGRAVSDEELLIQYKAWVKHDDE